MNVNNKTSQINILASFYLAFIFSLNLFFNENLFSPITFLIFILCVLILIFKDIHNSLTSTKILILILIFISLSSPTRDWDARSIWMFHGKEIFYENNLFAQFDNYGFQNEYPIFISYYAAQLARMIGSWNEIFPKLSTLLIAIPSIIYLSGKAKNKFHELIIIFLYTFFFGKSLINGEADALLGLYFTSIFFFIFLNHKQLNLKSKNALNILFLISLIIIFSNLKTNSFVLFVILLISVFLFLKNKTKIKNLLIISFFSLIPLSYFRYNVFMQDLTGIFFNSFFEVNFFQILTNFSELLIIINEIFINKYFLFTLIFFFIFIFLNKKIFLKKEKNHYVIKFNKSFNFLFAAIFIYSLHVIFLITVLMILSSEIYFDVVVLSLKRYMFPILFFLSYLIVYATFNPNLKNQLNAK